MTTHPTFPPTLQAARDRVAAVRPSEYARTRNNVDGAVTFLSPYITHAFVSLPEVLTGVAQNHPLHPQHKFIFELGWREYFHHVWQHRGDGILASLHEGPLPESAYAAELPADIREGCTGLPVIDQAVRALYATGYLHNHARMWLASYIVHLRKVHWRAGADWMVAHLLDGDLASNHLSWQWVAGTGSKTPYLFNAENVARLAPASWRSEGTVLDTSYESLNAIAVNADSISVHPADARVDEPTVMSRGVLCDDPDAIDVQDRDVWLVHPWALGDPPADLSADCVRIGWWPAEHFAAWPWSKLRWDFVGARMSAITTRQWYGTKPELIRVLSSARSVQTVRDLHVGALPPSQVVEREPARIFAPVEPVCVSFSSWWKKSARALK